MRDANQQLTQLTAGTSFRCSFTGATRMSGGNVHSEVVRYLSVHKRRQVDISLDSVLPLRTTADGVSVWVSHMCARVWHKHACMCREPASRQVDWGAHLFRILSAYM